MQISIRNNCTITYSHVLNRKCKRAARVRADDGDIELVSLLAATWEHQIDIRALRSQVSDTPRSTAGVVVALIAIAGILALTTMILRNDYLAEHDGAMSTTGLLKTEYSGTPDNGREVCRI